MFLDDDDTISNDYVEKFYSEIKNYSKIDVLIFRMYNKKDSNYINSPWPKIYSETDNNDKNPGKAYFKGNDLILYKPEIYPLCYYNNSPCTHDINVQFTIDEIRFKKKYGYKIYFFGQ